MQEEREASLSQRMPELTIRGAAEARTTEHDNVTSATDEVVHGLPEPQASTSAVTLENGHLQTSSATLGSSTPPRDRPWGLAGYGIPPPPLDLKPDPALEAKLRHFHSLRAQGIYFNDTLQNNKSFRNPSILSKLVDFVNVDEKLSAIPLDVWSSSHGVSPDAWAASIAEKQKQESEERERAQQRGKRSAIDFASSSSSSSSRLHERVRMSERESSSSNLRSSYTNDRKASRWDKTALSKRSEGRDYVSKDGLRSDRASHVPGRTRSRSPSGRRH